MVEYKGKIRKMIPPKNGSKRSYRVEIELIPHRMVRYHHEMYRVPGFSGNRGYLANKLKAKFYENGNIEIPEEALTEIVRDLHHRGLLKKVDNPVVSDKPIRFEEEIQEILNSEENPNEDSSVRPAITEEQTEEPTKIYFEPQQLENKVA